jgi:glycosyltransferase involved in cell wall biosynthesis
MAAGAFDTPAGPTEIAAPSLDSQFFPVPVPDLISVVMPCYNAEAFVAQAVESVFDQTYPNVELIVVDDGSRDASVDVLRRYGNRLTLLQQRNEGPYPARNRGVAASSGDFLAFLDADDWWSADCLESLHEASVASGASVAYCGWQNVGLPGPRGEPHVPPDYENDNKLDRFLRAAAPWPIHAALLRRSVWDEVGGFDTSLPTVMDYDLWLRVGASRPVVRVEKVMAFYRHHQSGQITSQQWRQAENSWRVKRRFLASNPGIARQLGPRRVRELVDGGLLRRGYDAYWRRDFVSAQRIFRSALRHRAWSAADLKYLLPALLPTPLYTRLLGMKDGGAPTSP